MTINDDTVLLTEEESALLRNLGGVAEISREFSVPRTTISMWDSRREQSGFPEPVERLSMGPIYDMRAVRAWFIRRGQA